MVQYNRIKIVLAEKDVSQKELVDYLGVSANTVSRWCRNLAQPSLHVLNNIAEFLHVDVRELLVPNKLPSIPIRNK